jgi:glycosyltransferase involved in cell wall biosynthesis
MKISVVIPTYRRPQLLLRCVEALTRQVFPKDEYEIIIISDGPDDATRQALLQAIPERGPIVRFHSLSKKNGPAAARNYGWRIARSNRLIAFTDDDCIPDAKWLLAFWNAFLRSPGNKSAFTGKTIVPIPAIPTDYERNIAQLENAEFITANCACTKAALEKVGGFDEQFTMAWREDSDLQFKLLEHRIPIINVKNAVVTHPVRKAPWGVSIKEEKKGVFNALLYKKFPALYKKRIQPSPPWHYYAILAFICLFVAGALSRIPWLMMISFAGWAVLTGWFIARRLANTSHSVNHVLEMTVTSVIIPVLSIYYRLYGSWKFKAPLLP